MTTVLKVAALQQQSAPEIWNGHIDHALASGAPLHTLWQTEVQSLVKAKENAKEEDRMAKLKARLAEIRKEWAALGQPKGE